MMQLYGFVALSPPSNLYQTGAVVALNHCQKPGGQLEVESLRLLCGPRASLGPELLPTESQTLAGVQKFYSKQTMHVDSSVLDRLKTNTRFEKIVDVEIRLDNARIIEVTDADVWESMQNRSEACTKAIAARIAQGFQVTMISSNIVADLVYTVKFSSETTVDKKAQTETLRQLAVSLGGGHTQVTDQQIYAKNLAVGLKTDNYLLAISLPNEDQRALKQQPRHLEAATVDVDATEADAPIVHPSSSVLGTRKKVW